MPLNTNSKLGTITTAVFCLFSSAALASARSLRTAADMPPFDHLLDLALSTSTQLQYTTSIALSPYAIVNETLNYNSELMTDPMYAQISAGVNLNAGVDSNTALYSTDQAAAYITMAVDNLLSFNLTDQITDQMLAKNLDTLISFNTPHHRNSAKQRQQANTVVNTMLKLEDSAKELGIDLAKCKPALHNTPTTIQNSLSCLMQNLKNGVGSNAKYYKTAIVHKVPNLVKTYAVALDHAVMQLGLLQAILPAFIGGTAPDITTKHLKALISVTTQAYALRDLMSVNEELKDKFTFLFSQARNYALQGGSLDTATRINNLLPELARALTLVGLEGEQPIYPARLAP